MRLSPQTWNIHGKPSSISLCFASAICFRKTNIKSVNKCFGMRISLSSFVLMVSLLFAGWAESLPLFPGDEQVGTYAFGTHSLRFVVSVLDQVEGVENIPCNVARAPSPKENAS
jgi:hypothetical protein